MTRPLDRLAALAGIESRYVDYWGRERLVGEGTKRELLAAMGFEVDDAQAEAAAAELTAERTRNLAPLIVGRVGAPIHVPLPPNPGSTSRWSVRCDDGSQRHGTARSGAARLDLDALPAGYHRLTMELRQTRREATIMVAPERAYWPEQDPHRRHWGLAVALFGVRSQRNWGIGDFSDLATLAARIAAAGGDALGVTPLHELRPHEPTAASPYSPSSRYWLNWLAIDPEATPEFAQLDGDRRDALRRDLPTLRAVPTVEYAEVARAKRAALEALYEVFQRGRETAAGGRTAAFARFVARGGASLERLARFEAIAEAMRAVDPFAHGWRAWPEAYRSPESPQVEAFARERPERVDFFRYLQFVADEQLAAAVRAGGERTKLYLDLAVGCDLDGADAWSDQATIVAGAALGAPPDPLNALGQNWGLPPFSPLALRKAAYRPFAELLRANMRHAGYLRIDHAIGLMRCFWIPRGRTPADGAYVRYDLDAMLAIVALESHRNRCAAIGEDLGTVPDELRRRMHDAGVLSTRLTFFERSSEDGGFIAPEHYPQLAAASVASHDLAPIAGWWQGDDIAVRVRLRLYPDDDAARAAGDERFEARFKLIDALHGAGALDERQAARLRDDARRSGTDEAALAIEGMHRFLAQTPARLAMVQLVDLFGEVDAINLPGTVDEHPNWCRKRRYDLESSEFEASLDALRRLFGAREVAT